MNKIIGKPNKAKKAYHRYRIKLQFFERIKLNLLDAFLLNFSPKNNIIILIVIE